MNSNRKIKVILKGGECVKIRRDKEARLKEIKSLKDLALEMARRIEKLEREEQAA